MNFIKMDVAIKLDFDNCDDSSIHSLSDSMCDLEESNNLSTNIEYNELDNSLLNFSTCTDFRIIDSSPNNLCIHNDESPPYKRVRALRLFDSPATPKTLLEKCAADSSTCNTTSSSSYGRGKMCRKFVGLGLDGALPCTTPQPSSSKSVISTSSGSNTKARHTANINPFTPDALLLSKKRTRSSSGDSTSSRVPPTVDNSSSQSCGSCLQEDSATENVATTRLSLQEANVSRYYEEFLEVGLIGKGEFGSVYKCRHRLDGCIYAIKKSLKPVAGSVNERIALNEVYAHAVLGKHPHVVRYYSAWAENSHMIIQNEHCNGGSLGQRGGEGEMNRRMQETQLRLVLLHVARGLKYIHSQQLVHLDIKPDNIFVSYNHGTEDDRSNDDFTEEDEEAKPGVVYKIGDLGHVTSVVNPQVEEGDCRYLPKEILQEDYMHLQKADIFALGLTVYELAQGRPLPLNGPDWHALRDGYLPILPGMSNHLHLLLKAMTHPDPIERPTAAQLLQQLNCSATLKSNLQLQRELDAEKLKNEILSRQLQEAAMCLQSLAPCSASMTAARVSGVLAGVAPSKAPRACAPVRLGPTTRNSRLVGKKGNRTTSNLHF